MKTSLQIVTLETIAKKLGVSPDRYSYVRKVYEDNRHSPTMMLMQLKLPSLSDQEKICIMTYIGAVIAGQAIDEKLYGVDLPN